MEKLFLLYDSPDQSVLLADAETEIKALELSRRFRKGVWFEFDVPSNGAPLKNEIRRDDLKAPFRIHRALKDVLDTIRSPQCWIKEGTACTLDGEPVSPSDPLAIRYSLIGAIMAVWSSYGYPDSQMPVLCNILNAEIVRLGVCRGGTLIPFNDHPDTTHEDVLALIHKALQAVK